MLFRYFKNPFFWDWVVVPQVEIPEGKLGVRTRLYGDNLGPGDLIAWSEGQKGIVPEVLRPGRHAINAWVVGTSKRGDDSYAVARDETGQLLKRTADFSGGKEFRLTVSDGDVHARAAEKDEGD